MVDEQWWEIAVLKRGGVVLEPLSELHAKEWADQHDSSLFAFMARGAPPSPDVAGYRSLIQRLMAPSRRLNWAIRVDGLFAGRISAIDVDPSRLEIEIGTMLTARQIGGIANPASKLLLMSRYFDDLGLLRCAFRVDERNGRSIRAMEKLGAVFEGSQRRVIHGGDVRTESVYAVHSTAWPQVRAGLEQRVARLEAKS